LLHETITPHPWDMQLTSCQGNTDPCLIDGAEKQHSLGWPRKDQVLVQWCRSQSEYFDKDMP
jgi:hypothetical protein